jgi:hypothetical protein
MGRTVIVVRDARGTRTSAVTDLRGNARFALAPGRYAARFTRNRANTCDAGAEPARATVIPHHLTWVDLYCDAA